MFNLIIRASGAVLISWAILNLMTFVVMFGHGDPMRFWGNDIAIWALGVMTAAISIVVAFELGCQSQRRHD